MKRRGLGESAGIGRDRCTCAPQSSGVGLGELGELAPCFDEYYGDAFGARPWRGFSGPSPADTHATVRPLHGTASPSRERSAPRVPSRARPTWPAAAGASRLRTRDALPAATAERRSVATPPPWIRCPTMSYGLHVSGPSVASVQTGESPASIACSVDGGRSRTATPASRSKSIVLPKTKQGPAGGRSRVTHGRTERCVKSPKAVPHDASHVPPHARGSR